MAEELPDPEERLEQLQEGITTAYMLVSVLLEQLPVPIRVPSLEDEDWNLMAAMVAMDRARSVLLDEEPIPHGVRALYRRMLTEWLVAYDLGAFTTMAGPAPWRLDGIEATLRRLSRVAEILDPDHPLNGGDEPLEE